MVINQVTRGGKDYIGYDYKTVVIGSAKLSLYTDAYKCFGWLPDDSAPAKEFIGVVTMKLKRDRKILNKAELTRLQQNFEACMDEIMILEQSKTRFAKICSLTVGVIGAAFIAGSVFAVTNEPPLIVLCVMLGLPGLICWALPYLLYKYLSKRRVVIVSPLIELKYDDIHKVCEKGHALVHI